MSYYLAFDFDKIHNYIFSPRKLKEIIGGSSLLDEFNRKDIMEITGDKAKVIFSGGGTGLIEMQNENDAVAMKSEIKNALLEKTGNPMVTVEYVEATDNFKNDIKKLFAKIKKAKMLRKESVTIPPISAQKCESCGVRLSVENNDSLCQLCQKKSANSVDYFFKSYKDLFKGDNDRQCDNLEELGRYSNPENYIGLIYADGNRIGQKVKTITAEEVYKKFSSAIDNATRESVFEILYSTYKQENNFRIILLGGDDIIIVTTAEKALLISKEIAKKFEEKTKNVLENVPNLSLSFGVLLMKSHFPMATGIELAGQLMKEAKRKSFKIWSEQNQKEVSVIDFMVLSESASERISDIRSEMIVQSGSSKYIKTMKPYSRQELGNFIETVKKVNALPRSRLYSIFETLSFDDPAVAEFNYRTIKSRSTAKDKEILDGINNGNLWSSNSATEFYTPFADAVEAADFIE